LKVAQCLNMHSGIRISDEKARTVMRNPEALKGQAQVQAILTHSTPVTRPAKRYKYQGTDPSIVMQVIEAVVPGSAEDFIRTEMLDKLGIKTFVWQPDVSGLPKSAAGSSMRSRDMLKFGIVIADQGKWQGEQLFPAQYIRDAVGPLYTNPVGHTYGYFWWGSTMKVGETEHHCISGRGAGGQFILVIPTSDLIVIATSHNKGGMRQPLEFTEQRILPAFASVKVRPGLIAVARTMPPVQGAAPSESGAPKAVASKPNQPKPRTKSPTTPPAPAQPVPMLPDIAERAARHGLEMPRLFGDHMILQQNTSNAVWGWAKVGQQVTVKASWGAIASARAGKDGRWQVLLDTPRYGTGHSLTISGDKTIKDQGCGHR
ncbi:MAG: serine hydrolase, partial [Planctomycetaceae bacterium]